MKKIVLLLVVVFAISSCATNRTYIRDYSQQIELIKTNFPEIYRLYCNGYVIIDAVYTYEKDGREQVRVRYRYR